MMLLKALPSWLSLGLLAAEFLAFANAHAYSNCQTTSNDPLKGCPKGTLLVSATHKNAKFASIQSAILSLDAATPATILILNGTYTEQLNVTRVGPLTLLGEIGKAGTNLVTVQFAAANVNVSFPDNAYTSVLTVAPTLEASLTGSGPTGYPVPAGTPFGNTDFRAYNIDFRNIGQTISTGPALAVSVSYANAGFYFSGFYSYQDTVYIGKLGNAYFFNNTIAGQTDFFYGFGTAFIESSKILMRTCGGGVTAWKGTNTTFTNKYGVYISDSYLTQENSALAPSLTGKCFLGRPWNSQHRSLFLNTYMDASINAAGYKKWVESADPAVSKFVPGLTVMAEYESYGPGFNLTGRIAGNVTIEFTKKQTRAYDTPLDVFMSQTGTQPYVGWIDKHFF